MTDPMIFRIHVTPPIARARAANARVPVTANGLARVIVASTEGKRGPIGLPGTGVPIVGEIPAGAKNGINTIFTTTFSYAPNTVALYLNGLREDYFTETSSTTITLEDPPDSTDKLSVDYVVQ